jgi:SAM-dependent methyltransferase
VKLNLASGTDLRPHPWVNLDIVHKWPLATRGCDVIWDARKDRIPYPDASVDEVYAGYLFLHLAPHHHARVLADIRRVLQPGGRLVVGEVEMDTVLSRWILNPTDARLAELIWGEQGELPRRECMACEVERLEARRIKGYSPLLCSDCIANEEQRRLAEFDKHCSGFTERTLREFLARGGFTNARRISIHAQPAVWYELTLEAFR